MSGKGLYICSVVLLIVNGQNECSSDSRCTCRTFDHFRILANCSHLNLTTSPVFHNNNSRVFWIDLSYNSLTNSPLKGTLPDQLQWMDISHNIISKFPKDSFSGLQHLKVLNISNNQLMLNQTIFYNEVFRDLKSLEHLDIQKNLHQETGFPRQYPDQAIGQLKSLTNLAMDGIPGYILGSGFLENCLLETLNFTGVTGICKIYNLTEDFFSNVPSLKYLDLSHCALNQTRKTFSRSLQNLVYLDVSYNRQLTMCGLKNITEGLNSTSIKVLKAKGIYCTLGRGIYVARNFLSSLQNSSLEELHLDENRMDYMYPAISLIIPSSLKSLSLVGNRLTPGIYMYRDFSTVTGLEVLDIGFQHRHPNDLPLHEQYLCDDYNRSFECESRNRDTYPYNQQMQDWPVQKHATPTNKASCDDASIVDLSIPKNLKSLHFDFSRVGSTIEGVTLGYYHKIENFSIRGNTFTEWRGPLCNVSTLKYMDLSENLCSKVSSYFFDNFSNLKTLLLESNYLVYPLSQDKQGQIFKGLRNLEHLSLFNNRIDKLPQKIFKGLISLKTLNLSTNGLKDITFSMKYFHLSALDLSSNYVQYLSKTSMMELDNHHGISVNLMNNTLVCTCESIPFLKWMKERLRNTDKRVYFISFHSYRCRVSNGTSLSLYSYLEAELSRLERNCFKTEGYVVALLTFGIIGVLAILIAFLVNKQKWKIRYFLYVAKRELMKRNYEPLRNTEDYNYDVFVSYADEDRTFVLQEVMPRFEEKFHVCIHDKDFIPGSDIADNIIGAIRNSRKTLLVISKHFIKSEWCMYEFNMALFEEKFTRKSHSLIFIFKGDIAIEKLPLKMAEARDSTVFADFPVNAEDEAIFWQTLERALLDQVL
ncbi:toll-like receptor 4 [Saccostrea cucullata]|uniref:toll-like receptor 4 n=1 Tax=Saccostrea cuccullata TaxID=36930 RepID=UPI002ED245DB